MSKIDDAYKAIKTRIANRKFKIGHELSETALSRQLGMGRPSVRLALFRLQEEGFVRMIPRQGFKVLTAIPPKKLPGSEEVLEPLSVEHAETMILIARNYIRAQA